MKLSFFSYAKAPHMEHTLPEDHPDLIKIVQAAHADVAPKPPKGEGKSMAAALALALGNAPGTGVDQENIEFLIHVLSVNRASGAIDDEAFEQLLQRIKTREGRADLAALFSQELEAEHGFEENEDDEGDKA